MKLNRINCCYQTIKNRHVKIEGICNRQFNMALMMEFVFDRVEKLWEMKKTNAGCVVCTYTA